MLDELKNEIEEAAFMLIDDASRKEIHAKLIHCLVVLDKIKGNNNLPIEMSEDAVSSEVNKVARRLKMWSKPDRQAQYNSQILNAYLDLKRSGSKKITEEDISAHIGANTWFWPNFAQMKVIADRNHGKIFDVDGHYVKIWKSIESAVKEYEKTVFHNA